MNAQVATALIAEDEPLLAENLRSELARLWPALHIVAVVSDGDSAVREALAKQPTLLFLDIRMPGAGGLDAAQMISEEWPAGSPLPLIVFVTAYDQYAVSAFERAAFDYVLKPVRPERLAQTCSRLQAALAQRDSLVPAAGQAPASRDDSIEAALAPLRNLLAHRDWQPPAPAAAPLRVLQAGVGSAVHFVPVDEVLYFEAADKYVRAVTLEREHLLRTSLRELLPQLDAQRFWQIHRSTAVRIDAVSVAQRDETGRITLTLRDHPDRLAVSRLYAGLFKAM